MFIDRNSFAFNNKIKSYNNLKALLLNNNKLTKLYSNLFINLNELTYINLNHNFLKIIGSKIFKYNTKLVIIDVSYNKIKRFNADLSELPYIHTLDIKHNYLTTLTESAFKSFISGNGSVNNSLIISNNQLLCKCKMFWIQMLGNTLKANISHDVSCFGDINKNTRLGCFFNTNEETNSTCSRMYTTYCDEG